MQILKIPFAKCTNKGQYKGISCNNALEIQRVSGFYVIIYQSADEGGIKQL